MAFEFCSCPLVRVLEADLLFMDFKFEAEIVADCGVDAHGHGEECRTVVLL